MILSTIGYYRTVVCFRSFSSELKSNANVRSISQTYTKRDEIYGTFSANSDMDITFLGTGAGVPCKERGVSSLCLRYKGHVWMFDCGESTQLQLQQSKIKFSKINKIFITHMHGDHVFGLPGVLCQLGVASGEEDSRRTTPLDIYGPEGIRNYLRAILQLTHSKSAIQYRIHELKDIESSHPFPRVVITTTAMQAFGELPGGTDIFPKVDSEGRVTYEICQLSFHDSDHRFNHLNTLTVHAAPIKHSIPCVGYVVTESSQPGTLLIDKIEEIARRNKDGLIARGFPLYQKVFAVIKNLKPDESYEFPDGTIVYGRDVVTEELKGRKVAILGDTSSARGIEHLAMDADMLIHESTNPWLGEDDNYELTRREAVSHGHSTQIMAGEFAKKIRAKRVLLNHISQRYPSDDSDISLSKIDDIESTAAKAGGFIHVKTNKHTNPVIVAWDQLRVSINRSVTKDR